MTALTKRHRAMLRRVDESPIGLRCLEDEELEDLNVVLDIDRKSAELTPDQRKAASDLVALIQALKERRAAEREFVSSYHRAIYRE